LKLLSPWNCDDKASEIDHASVKSCSVSYRLSVLEERETKIAMSGWHTWDRRDDLLNIVDYDDFRRERQSRTKRKDWKEVDRIEMGCSITKVSKTTVLSWKLFYFDLI